MKSRILCHCNDSEEGLSGSGLTGLVDARPPHRFLQQQFSHLSGINPRLVCHLQFHCPSFFYKEKNMPATHHSEPLTDALQRLEQQLELPYISGELKAWADEVVEELKSVETSVNAAIHTDHPRSFHAIVKNQRNLQQQVDKLSQEDAEIPPALCAVRQQADAFAASIDETALAGQQFQAKRERLVNDGLAIVLRIRRQKAAIDTWFGEALQRDNGVGD